ARVRRAHRLRAHLRQALERDLLRPRALESVRSRATLRRRAATPTRLDPEDAVADRRPGPPTLSRPRPVGDRAALVTRLATRTPERTRHDSPNPRGAARDRRHAEKAATPTAPRRAPRRRRRH